MNRPELAAFLRARRAKLRPVEAGLPERPRRRTPGLRRQEVAQLAGMSVEYYIRLEQARGPRPSRQILNALGRALMLTMDERQHLFHLAGETVSPASRVDRDVPTGIKHVLATLTETPAYVIDAKYDILAWNELAVFFIGDLERPGTERNMLRWVFGSPLLQEHLCSSPIGISGSSSTPPNRAARPPRRCRSCAPIPSGPVPRHLTPESANPERRG